MPKLAATLFFMLTEQSKLFLLDFDETGKFLVLVSEVLLAKSKFPEVLAPRDCPLAAAYKDFKKF